MANIERSCKALKQECDDDYNLINPILIDGKNGGFVLYTKRKEQHRRINSPELLISVHSNVSNRIDINKVPCARCRFKVARSQLFEDDSAPKKHIICRHCYEIMKRVEKERKEGQQIIKDKLVAANRIKNKPELTVKPSRETRKQVKQWLIQVQNKIKDLLSDTKDIDVDAKNLKRVLSEVYLGKYFDSTSRISKDRRGPDIKHFLDAFTLPTSARGLTENDIEYSVRIKMRSEGDACPDTDLWKEQGVKKSTRENVSKQTTATLQKIGDKESLAPEEPDRMKKLSLGHETIEDSETKQESIKDGKKPVSITDDKRDEHREREKLTHKKETTGQEKSEKTALTESDKVTNVRKDKEQRDLEFEEGKERKEKGEKPDIGKIDKDYKLREDEERREKGEKPDIGKVDKDNKLGKDKERKEKGEKPDISKVDKDNKLRENKERKEKGEKSDISKVDQDNKLRENKERKEKGEKSDISKVDKDVNLKKEKEQKEILDQERREKEEKTKVEKAEKEQKKRAEKQLEKEDKEKKMIEKEEKKKADQEKKEKEKFEKEEKKRQEKEEKEKHKQEKEQTKKEEKEREKLQKENEKNMEKVQRDNDKKIQEKSGKEDKVKSKIEENGGKEDKVKLETEGKRGKAEKKEGEREEKGKEEKYGKDTAEKSGKNKTDKRKTDETGKGDKEEEIKGNKEKNEASGNIVKGKVNQIATSGRAGPDKDLIKEPPPPSVKPEEKILTKKAKIMANVNLYDMLKHVTLERRQKTKKNTEQSTDKKKKLKKPPKISHPRKMTYVEYIMVPEPPRYTKIIKNGKLTVAELPIVKSYEKITAKPPIMFKRVERVVDASKEVILSVAASSPKVASPTLKPNKPKPEQKEPLLGITRYSLSDRKNIENGLTILPTEKVVRKINVYKMHPAHPEFDWFARNKHKKFLYHDTGEQLAEIFDNGCARMFYKNGKKSLDYYEAEETNVQKRFVVYSNGLPDAGGRPRSYTVLASFDYLGNGIVYDHTGKIRLKYNQTEGVILDTSLGPVSNWKWHALNDPPVLQQVMIDTHLPQKDPTIQKLGPHDENLPRPDNEDMLAIEFDNFIREKREKLSQKFRPFQIKMKALKINENFSLKILDQASVFLHYRSGKTTLKLNLGMILDHQEIVDTDTADVGDVVNSMVRLPARTDSVSILQKSVGYAQKVERAWKSRQRRICRVDSESTIDRKTKPLSRPRPTVMTVSHPHSGEPCQGEPSSSPVKCKC